MQQSKLSPAISRAAVIILFLAAMLCGCADSAEPPAPGVGAAQHASLTSTSSAADTAPALSTEDPGSSWRAGLWRFFLGFLTLCAFALLLLVLVVVFLLWQAKKLIEKAIRPDLPKLQRKLERLRAKHPDLDADRLAGKIISGGAHRAGFIGLITGIGGLPAMPIMLPIDIAATVKIQSNMIYMLRLLRMHGDIDDEDLYTQAGLWAVTSGGQHLVNVSATAFRELILKSTAKALIKFLPLLGGVIGYVLNWLSTQAMGRTTKVLAARKTAVDPEPAS